MQPAALKTPSKTMPNMAGRADKIFQGSTKIFNTIAFRADNFFLDSTSSPGKKKKRYLTYT